MVLVLRIEKYKVSTVHFLTLEIVESYDSYHIARINSPPMAGKPGQNMVPHLSKCVYVAPDVKSRAITRATAIQNTSIGRSVSMPLSAIVFPGADHPSTFPAIAISATPSPVPSPLLFAPPLPTFDRPPKRLITSSLNLIYWQMGRMLMKFLSHDTLAVPVIM